MRSAGTDAVVEAGMDVDAIIATATTTLASEADEPLWSLADEIARLRAADPREIELVRELIAVLIRRAERSRGSRSARPR